MPFSHISVMGQKKLTLTGEVNYSPSVFNSVYSLKTQELETEGYTVKADAGIALIQFGDNYSNSNKISRLTATFSHSNFGEKSALNSLTSFGLNVGVGYRARSNEPLSTEAMSGLTLKWLLLNAAEDNTLLHHQYIEYLADGVRFGNSYYQSFGFDFSNTITLSAKIERTFIHPRFIVEKGLVNEIIYAIALLPGMYVNATFSEVSAPALGFVLGTLYQYGITEIKKKNKSWPFDIPSPVTMDEISLGVTFKL
ncbi:MAG: hypothetical protein FWG85_04120 [Bacteroidetes bacterium]|nr:hypothetical protein [Bacteroidota bacterium]